MSTDALSLPGNRTNVRTKHRNRLDAALHRSAWPLRALMRVSPELAARAATRAFFTTYRPPVRPEEAAALASFDRSSLPFAGRRLPTWSLGRGPLVLLNHGWSGRAAQLAPLAAAVASAGFRAVVFDHPAHGEAEGATTTLPAMADALLAIDAALGGADAIVAHSMGTIHTTLGLSRGLAARRLVYLAPSIVPARWQQGFARRLGLGAAIDAPMVRAIERRAGVPMADLDPRPLAAALTTPLLIVHDRLDREVAYEEAGELAALWRGATLVTTEGLGHHRIVRDPAVGERTLAFLAPLRR